MSSSDTSDTSDQSEGPKATTTITHSTQKTRKRTNNENNEIKANKGTFSTVFIDLDDTLIPTSMYLQIYNNFGIDIFAILASSELIALQNEIISIIKQIQKIIQKYKTEDDIVYCIVSNADTEWLKSILYSDQPIMSVLGKYLKQNNIEILSAPNEAEKIQKNQKFDKSKTSSGSKDIFSKKWMPKYVSFAKTIAKNEILLNKKCHQIISIGDGECERKASEIYAIRNKDINVISIKFICHPTVNQLEQQWNSVKTILNHIMFKANKPKPKSVKSDDKLANNFYGVTLNDLYKNDNDPLCIGKSQLQAFKKYFTLFINYVEKQPLEEQETTFKRVQRYIRNNVRSSMNSKTSSSARTVQIRKLVNVAASCSDHIDYI